jgi:hypothetical protein
MFCVTFIGKTVIPPCGTPYFSNFTSLEPNPPAGGEFTNTIIILKL